MNDIVRRLRDSVTQCRALDRSQLLEEAATEIERLRITDAERGAIADAADRYAEITPESAETAVTLRVLLERVK